MKRRQYLTTAAVATSLALAGCGGTGNGGGNGTTASGGEGGATTAAGGEETPTPASGEATEAATAAEPATTGAGGGAGVTPTTMREPSPTAAGTPMATETTMATATTGGGVGSSSSAVSIESSEFTKATETEITEAAMTGEVTATGGRVASLELQAIFRNDAGDVLSTEPAFFQGLDEGQTWLFYIPLLGDAQAATEGEVSVVSATVGSAPPAPQAEVVESNLSPSPDEFTGPTVTGRAQNTGSSTLSYLEARVKFLTDDGTALDSDFTNVTDLPAGETWSFSVEQIVFSTDERPEAADYEVTLAA